MLAYTVGGKDGGSTLTFLLCAVGVWRMARSGRRSLLIRLLAPFALTFVAATASYFLVERPYRRRRWAFYLRTAGAFAAAGVIVFGALALPLPKRLDHQQAAAAVDKIAMRHPATRHAPARRPVLPAPHRLLVVGDSVGQLLTSGFAHEARAGVAVTDSSMTF